MSSYKASSPKNEFNAISNIKMEATLPDGTTVTWGKYVTEINKQGSIIKVGRDIKSGTYNGVEIKDGKPVLPEGVTPSPLIQSTTLPNGTVITRDKYKTEIDNNGSKIILERDIKSGTYNGVEIKNGTPVLPKGNQFSV